jgi:hypothetical protein
LVAAGAVAPPRAVPIDEVVEHLGDRLSPSDRERIAAYRSRYGVPSANEPTA